MGSVLNCICCGEVSLKSGEQDLLDGLCEDFVVEALREIECGEGVPSCG